MLAMVLTTEDVWREGAAGDPQVVGVLLCMELVHVQVPQTQVSVCGAGHEYLAAGAEGAGYHCRVSNSPSPAQTKPAAAASIARFSAQLSTVCCYHSSPKMLGIG